LLKEYKDLKFITVEDRKEGRIKKWIRRREKREGKQRHKSVAQLIAAHAWIQIVQ